MAFLNMSKQNQQFFSAPGKLGGGVENVTTHVGGSKLHFSPPFKAVSYIYPPPQCEWFGGVDKCM